MFISINCIRVFLFHSQLIIASEREIHFFENDISHSGGKVLFRKKFLFSVDGLSVVKQALIARTCSGVNQGRMLNGHPSLVCDRIKILFVNRSKSNEAVSV